MGHGSRQISDFWTSENLSKMSAQQPFESKVKLMFCIIERKMVSKGISLQSGDCHQFPPLELAGCTRFALWTALLFKEAHDTDRAPSLRRLHRPLLASPLPSLALRHRFPAVARRRTRRWWRHVPAHH